MKIFAPFGYLHYHDESRFRRLLMRKTIVFLCLCLCFGLGCQKKDRQVFTIGIFQINEAPHLNAVREGFIKSLEDAGLREGQNIRLIIRDGNGSILTLHHIALEFAAQNVNMIVPLSTPCLQAALHATQKIPIVFSSVANPVLAGAGNSFYQHLSYVTGMASKSPIQESLEFIKTVLPHVKRIGTLWTPYELNSEYYLDLARQYSKELGISVISVPVSSQRDVFFAAQKLAVKNIDAIYQISDNTINASFEDLSEVADEYILPLFGGFLLATRFGACAALGWDFFEMGYKTGKIAIRVKNGENPRQIPFQSMKKARLFLNLGAAEKQGVAFSKEILERADQILKSDELSTVSSLD